MVSTEAVGTPSTTSSPTWPGLWAAGTPPYALILADAPDHLVPEALRSELDVDADRLPHGSVWSQIEGISGPPPGVVTPNAIHHDAWTAWVRHPGHGACLPYLLDEVSVRATESVAVGWPVARPLDRLRRWQLLASGVLTYPGRDEAIQLRWGRAASAARESFEAHGFVNMPAVVEPLHFGRLRRHYRAIERRTEVEGLQRGDPQTPDRLVALDEPVARFFHVQLTGLVAAVVGRPVKPTFCYSSVYVGGIGLPVHVDQPRCEYTLSVLLDAWPTPSPRSSWPLLLEASSGAVAVHQALGDGLVFRGREIPHRRPPLASGNTSTSLLFHYVDLDVVDPPS
jgi:hypothetical protein